MAYYAVVKNGHVDNVIIADQDWIDLQENNDEYIEFDPETSNASAGGEYDGKYFYPVKVYDSWVKDGSGNWKAPVPMPTDGKQYDWDEENIAWIEKPETPEL